MEHPWREFPEISLSAQAAGAEGCTAASDQPYRLLRISMAGKGVGIFHNVQSDLPEKQQGFAVNGAGSVEHKSCYREPGQN
ncbi:hypothetical protein SDC9_175346 [bioreactor metagenome]|uniref:Uncharacterized protein n=1 Tax=bioreactor metagenome TaxID=1076179 RepID=A0A645GPR1_9ZZZZ